MPEHSPSPSPRAFCRATGFVFQSAGAVLALTTCCWWSFSGRLQDPLRPTSGNPPFLSMADVPAESRWALAATCMGFLGGLAILVLGLGLQQERRHSAPAALGVTGLMAAFHAAYFIAAVVQLEPTVTRIILTGALALVWTVMFLLAGASAGEMRRLPPAPIDSTWTPRDEDDLRKGASPLPPDKTSP